jgi:hypothetical protein
MGKKSTATTSGPAGAQYRFEQRVKFTGTLESGQIIVTTNMVVTNKDLGHGIALRELFHLAPHVHVVIDGYLFDGDPLGFQQSVRADAIGTEPRAIHNYFRHTYLTWQWWRRRQLTPTIQMKRGQYCHSRLPRN